MPHIVVAAIQAIRLTLKQNKIPIFTQNMTCSFDDKLCIMFNKTSGTSPPDSLMFICSAHRQSPAISPVGQVISMIYW